MCILVLLSQSGEPLGTRKRVRPLSGLLYLNLGRLLQTSRNSLGPLRSRRLRRRRSSSVANGSLRRSISWPALARAFAALSVRTPAPWALGPYIRRERCRRHRYPSPSSRRISSAASYCRRGTKLGEIALARPCSSPSLPPPRASPPHTPGFSSSTTPASARSGSVSPCVSTRCPPAPSCRHGRRPSGHLDILVEPDAGAGLDHDRCERGLADLKRIAPQVVAVGLDQVEGV